MKKDQLWDDTSSMKKDWLCRTSCDEKNHEIAPRMIQIEWWLRSSDDSQWWSRSSDDRDPMMMIQQWWSRSSPVMLIQIERWSRSSDDVPWWSRSRDDPDPMMMLHDDPDREMIQIRRWRWLEDDADSMMIQMIQRRRLVLINSVERIPS